MATDRDRAHLRSIAEYEAKANADSLREDALRSPGQNIELGLQLSQFAASAAAQMGTSLNEEPPVPLSSVWRALQERRSRDEESSGHRAGSLPRSQ